MSRSDNIVQHKSYQFALKVIATYQRLAARKAELTLSRQLLKCGTSVGANVEEAVGAQSKKDFIAKLSIAYKEIRESNYWLRLMKDSFMLDEEEALPLLQDTEKLLRIIVSILKSAKA